MPEPKLSRQSFERLVRDHHAAVYSSSLRIVRDPASALDVTQDVYLALLSGRIVLTGDGDERVLRWFAARSSLQAVRARDSRRAREKGYAMQHANDPGSDCVEDRDESKALSRSIAQLPDDLRVPLQLRYFEDMTYEAVGDTLSISGPSAHERVKRALAALRDSLSRAGFAALSTGLEDHLTSSARAPVPLAPAHVARQLVRLHSAAAASSVSLALGLTVALVVLGVGGASWFAARHSQAAELALARSNALNLPSSGLEPSASDRNGIDASSAVSARSAALLTNPVSNSTPVAAEQTEFKGTIVGVLVDDGGLPVAGTVVIAESVEREGKIARYAGRGKSGRDGRFEIPVPIGPAGETYYTLVLEGRVELQHRGKDEFVRAAKDKSIDAGRLWLVPAPKDEPGEFSLDVEIVDPRGAPVAKVTAVLYRGVRSADGWSPHTWEVGGPSDDLGRVRLAGAHVGPKHLVVDARDLGFRHVQRDLEVRPGAQPVKVVLERGLAISGRLVDVEGHAVIPDPAHAGFGYDIQLHVHAPGADHDWIMATIDASGAFVVSGLDPGEYELGIGGGPWSPVCMSGVRAGTSDLVLTLKLDDDPRALGDHCAEIHARLVDALTQAPVKADILAAEAVKLSAGLSRAEFDLDYAPALLWQAPFQVEGMGDYPALSERVRRTGLAGGTYAFVARVPGYATAMVAPLVLAPHEVQGDLVLALVRPATIAGRVLDSDGRPCPDAFVLVNGSGPHSLERAGEADLEIVRTDGRPAEWRQDLVRTDAGGRFRFEDLAPDLTYTFSALHVHRLATTSGRVRGTTSDEVELRFVRAR